MSDPRLGLATMLGTSALGLGTTSAKTSWIWQLRQAQAPWVAKLKQVYCGSVLWTKIQSIVDLNSRFSKLWRLGMGLMLYFHKKVELSSYPLVEKIEALIMGVFQYFS